VSAVASGLWPADEVARRLIGELIAADGARPELEVDLSWQAGEPWAVRVRFVAADVTWLLGRELLGEGLVRPVGLGDLRVCLDEQDGGLLLDLASPSGCARVWLDAAEVTEFLVATYRVLGPEAAAAVVHAQIDAELAELADWIGGAW
jgi:hypothetical protein